MNIIDFTKTLKDVYGAGKKAREVKVAPGAFIAVDGKGRPGGDVFQKAVMDVYSTVYPLKFMLKFGGVLDFKICALECLWFSKPTTPMMQWEWRVMVRIPAEVTAARVRAAQKQTLEKKGTDVSAAKRIKWKGGRALQVLHVGPYDRVCAAYEVLGAFASEHGYTVTGPGHEIYLNDPRRTAPERLKTIVMLFVAKR
ncbi:MAG: GyrI-like domain-containing protein [Candidatus Hydrogenedentes bacterium]|nr:GyrI-like domain-containing protein [Candidatus Hydrogenedentota bacterium]